MPHFTEMPDDAEPSFDVVSLNVTGVSAFTLCHNLSQTNALNYSLFQEQNYAYFENIELRSMNYVIQVQAFSRGGSILTHADQSLQKVYESYLGETELF